MASTISLSFSKLKPLRLKVFVASLKASSLLGLNPNVERASTAKIIIGSLPISSLIVLTAIPLNIARLLKVFILRPLNISSIAKICGL